MPGAVGIRPGSSRDSVFWDSWACGRSWGRWLKRDDLAGDGAPGNIRRLRGQASSATPMCPEPLAPAFPAPRQTPATLDASACPSTGCAGVVADAYRGAVDQQLAAVEPLGALGVPTDPTGDWRGFTLMKDPKPKNDVYPLVRWAHGDDI